MRIEEAVTLIQYTPDSWARLEQFQRIPKGLDLYFGIHKGQRGKRVDAWKITCLEVHEAIIDSWDLGGMALYPSDHPAAREIIARRAEVRWSGSADETKIVGALYKAHTAAFYDWGRFDLYSVIHSISKNKFALRGPDFVMRVYAKALRSIVGKPQLILRRGKRKAIRPKVLHFGVSYVVANTFIAERCLKRNSNHPEPEIGPGKKNRKKTANHRRLADSPTC
jgi:hypothetical protein